MATSITASDLQYDYSKTAISGDDPRRTGVPDSTLLNRREQYEVLDFINRFCERTTYSNGGAQFGHAEALKAERLIREHLPSAMRSHANVNQWLLDNWSRFA